MWKTRFKHYDPLKFLYNKNYRINIVQCAWPRVKSALNAKHSKQYKLILAHETKATVTIVKKRIWNTWFFNFPQRRPNIGFKLFPPYLYGFTHTCKMLMLAKKMGTVIDGLITAESTESNAPCSILQKSSWNTYNRLEA